MSDLDFEVRNLDFSDSRIQLDGPSWLVRAFPTWNGRSMFAHIQPAAAAATAN